MFRPLTEMHRSVRGRARAIAVIATELAAVVHMEFAAAVAAVAAAQQPSQQQLALTGSSASERAADAGCVVGDGFEVAFELVPGDVGSVMILDQNVPFVHRPVHATTNALATVLGTHRSQHMQWKVRLVADLKRDAAGSVIHAGKLANEPSG